MPNFTPRESLTVKDTDKQADVLFIEDQNMLRLLAREAFGFEGISAVFAADGCEAMTYFDKVVADSTLTPRIVFLDIVLPCIDGHQVYTQLCQEPYRSRLTNTTIVITSADQQALTLPDGLLQTRVLYKPYEVGGLIDMIRSIAPDLFAKL